MTMKPGSRISAALLTASAAQQPMAKTMTAATTSPTAPKAPPIYQAKGRAASEPQVPGIFGRRPAPNHVASSIAGWWNGRPGGRVSRVIRVSQRQADRRDRLRPDALAPAGEAEALGRRCPGADPAARDAEDLGGARAPRPPGQPHPAPV